MTRLWRSVRVWARAAPRAELFMTAWAVLVFLGFVVALGMVFSGVHQLWLVYTLIALVTACLPPKLYFQFRRGHRAG